MAPNFSKNAILTSPIEFFCLICESYFRDKQLVFEHIEKSDHKKKLSSTTYHAKYQGDSIRKFTKTKNVYFCELCNLLLTTAPEVDLHIDEPRHKDKKLNDSIKRVGNNIVVFDVAIDETAWNGLSGDTCALCNCDYDDQVSHKKQTNHLLNLVQKQVEYDDKGNLYRKIEATLFHCLTCNKVLAVRKMISHFDEAHHKDILQKCRNKKESFPNKQEKKVAKENKPITIEKQQVPENKNMSKDVVFDNYDTIDESQFIEKTIPFTVKSDKKICEVLGAKNYITVDENGKKWCFLCDWVMADHSERDHVNSQHHQTILKLHNQRAAKKTKTIKVLKNDLTKTDIKVEKDATNNEMGTMKNAIIDSSIKNNTAVSPLQNDSESQSQEDTNNTRILENVARYQQNDVKINFLSNTAVCKQCSKNIDFNIISIEKHIQDHNQKPAVKKEAKPLLFKGGLNEENIRDKNTLYTGPVFLQSKSNDDTANASSIPESDSNAEIIAFATEHGLTCNNRKVYCTICNSEIPYSLKSMQDHIKGRKHVGKKEDTEKNPIKCLSPKTSSINLKKIPAQLFFKGLSTVNNEIFQDVIINEKYCLNFFSFILIMKISEVHWYCHLCESLIDDYVSHISKPQHVKLMEVPFIVEDASECIREIKPDVFHCGFCNVTEKSWQNMLEHLASVVHKDSKTAAQWRLQQYLPDLVRPRQQSSFQEAIINIEFFRDMLS